VGMEEAPPPPFRGRVCVVDSSGGGGGSGIKGGVIYDSGEDKGRGIDERRPPLPSVRTPLKRRGGMRWAVMSRRKRRTAPCNMCRRTPPVALAQSMTDSTASVSASTMAFIEGALGVVVFLVPCRNSGEVSGESSPFPFVLLCLPASECRACVRDNV